MRRDAPRYAEMRRDTPAVTYLAWPTQEEDACKIRDGEAELLALQVLLLLWWRVVVVKCCCDPRRRGGAARAAGVVVVVVACCCGEVLLWLCGADIGCRAAGVVVVVACCCGEVLLWWRGADIGCRAAGGDRTVRSRGLGKILGK